MSMIMFYVTFPSKESADKLSSDLIGQKMVACSNISSIHSTFWWKKEINTEDEWVAIYKTSFSNIAKVEQFVEKHHPYEVPCILHWEFNCNLSYEKWLRSNIVE